MLRMTDNMLLTALFVVFVGSTCILSYWLGRDTRSRHEFVRLAASRNPYTPPRDGSTDDIDGKPE